MANNLSPTPQLVSKLEIAQIPAMLHLKGRFNTNYCAKFQIAAMILVFQNLMVSKIKTKAIRYARMEDGVLVTALHKPIKFTQL